jgi:Uma2 family endonuclease
MNAYERGAGPPLLTISEYTTLPDDGGYRTELLRGRLVREPQPGGEHGVLAAELLARLGAHVRQRRLGRALVATGFQLPGEPHSVLGPDVAFVATARLPARTPVGFWQLAPDLAVEVRSPHDRWPDVLAKAHLYLESGTRCVWVVEPRRRRVHVFTTGAAPRVLSESDTLEDDDLVPGFSLPLAELFGAL